MFRMIFPVAVIFVFYLLEGVFPYYKERMNRAAHAFPNIGLSVINGLLTSVLFGGVTVAVILIAEKSHFSLLNLEIVPNLYQGTLAFILMDLWMYVWHRINHEIRSLWRLHRVHHNDPATWRWFHALVNDLASGKMKMALIYDAEMNDYLIDLMEAA